MRLENTFRIPVPAAEAWPVLLDLERIAPCVPGANLTSRDGDDFHGKIKVKLGPVGLTYNGIIKVVSQDPRARIAVLEGGGREARGNGTAKATITCRLVENDGGTDVFVETELAITGKPAQFGRGALADVAGTLIGQFADNLAAEITSTADDSSAAVDGPESADARSEIRAVPRPAAEPIDLLQAAGMDGTRRAAVAATAILVVLALILTRRRAAGRRARA
ncbi:SRPBCC family protein [Nocardia goodfellowii]|uniref:Carbon monoxide dehydrogenase subunit G n=1 Tax=Nocardia goodfellowii TaxID=882446 RepID=A0ABS4QK21_9NOCA|nr:SRPBCC family protein [Nocardia goodfellowii]MBP2191923.1 carbon monoxide dehydrogenase subunit G [Nocardia goodfellowii]